MMAIIPIPEPGPCQQGGGNGPPEHNLLFRAGHPLASCIAGVGIYNRLQWSAGLSLENERRQRRAAVLTAPGSRNSLDRFLPPPQRTDYGPCSSSPRTHNVRRPFLRHPEPDLYEGSLNWHGAHYRHGFMNERSAILCLLQSSGAEESDPAVVDDLARLYWRSALLPDYAPLSDGSVWVLEGDDLGLRLKLVNSDLEYFRFTYKTGFQTFDFVPSNPHPVAQFLPVPRFLLPAFTQHAGHHREKYAFLKCLFPKTTVMEFVKGAYQCTPFACPGGCLHLLPLTDSCVLAPSTEQRRLNVPGEEEFDFEQLFALKASQRVITQDGMVQIRSAHTSSPALRCLAADFYRAFNFRTRIDVFLVGASCSGRPCPAPSEEAFIFQLFGSEEWRLRHQTGQAPWRVEGQDSPWRRSSAPTSAGDSLVQDWSVTLRPGDWLYVPPGWEHSTRAVTNSVALAVLLDNDNKSQMEETEGDARQ